MKKKKHKKKTFFEKPVRFCDPGACDRCQYIGEGDFICDDHQVMVVEDWSRTDDYMICKKRNDRNERTDKSSR